MEVLGCVASVIAVATLALQSTKMIYEVASSISHGSDDIDRLVRVTSNLDKLLEIIKGLAEHAESTKSVAEGKLLEELTPLLEQCASALREIPPKLIQWQKDSKDRRWKKVKKHARIYLSNKGITEIWNTINHYVELLGSCLGNASVDIGLYNAQTLHLLRDELSAASRGNRSQLFQVEEILRDQGVLAQAGWDALLAEVRQGSLDTRSATNTQIQGIAELKTQQRQIGRITATGYENIAGIRTDVREIRAIIDDDAHQTLVKSDALMTEVREGISMVTRTSSAQIEDVRKMNAEITQKLHCISNRLEALPSIGSEQLSNLQSLVEMLGIMQLGMRTGSERPPTGSTIEASPIEFDRRNDFEADLDSETKIIARLFHFASKMTTCRYSKEAQSVIEEVGRLLGLVMQQVKAMSPTRNELPRKRKLLCDHHYSELETAVHLVENMGKAKRALTASERVRIRNKDTRRMDEGDHSTTLLPGYSPESGPENASRRRIPNINLQSIVGSWALQHSRLDAVFRTMQLPDGECKDRESADEAFAAKLLITPVSALQSKFKIVIDLASEIYRDRTIYLTPTLTLRAIIPEDSEVFHVVRGGSVRKLKKLLNSGAASLGDCDPMGRSLLNFALYECKQRMTRFLIQSGADVDSFEPRYSEYLEPHLVKPLGMIFFMNDSESADEDLERAERCYKLLLEAGSDLSVHKINDSPTNKQLESAFRRELRKGTLAKMKALIDLGEPFVSLECTGDNSSDRTTPLLLLASYSSEGFGTNFQMSAKIALLLTRGANVKATNIGGETCLHLILQGHYHPNGDGCWCYNKDRVRRHSHNIKDSVMLMISAGADVCAVDGYGLSVSDVAMNSGNNAIWMEALSHCSIDVRDVLARRNIDPARSTALSPEFSEPPRSIVSKISLVEYLELRKTSPRYDIQEWKAESQLYSSSEDEESEDEEGECDGSEDIEKHRGDLAQHTAGLTKANQNGDRNQNEENYINYDGDIAGTKAKLD